MTQYTDTCLEVGQEMQVQAQAAISAGIEPWRIILDPGAYCLNPSRSCHIHWAMQCCLTLQWTNH